MANNFTPAQPNTNIEVKPQVHTPTQRQPLLDGESFGAVVSWPLAQAVAVGGAAFMMVYGTLNYWLYGRVWVAMSISANFQLAALVGVLCGGGACIIFFMQNEISYIARGWGRSYAESRNTKEDQALVTAIYDLKNLCRVMETDIATLERDNARLEGQIRVQPKREVAPPPVSTGNIPDSAVEDARRHLEQYFTGQIDIEPLPVAPDDHTAQQMRHAMKILRNAYDTGSIARDGATGCKARQNMTTAEWESGRDFLMSEAVVGERAPRGYELLVDADAAIEALKRRIEARNQAKAAGMVGA